MHALLISFDIHGTHNMTNANIIIALIINLLSIINQLCVAYKTLSAHYHFKMFYITYVLAHASMSMKD